MKLPELVIGDLVAKIPIIQGGMGIGVSLSNLAGAVAAQGGIGIISGVQTGFREEDFKSNNLAANIRAIKNEIRKAREIAPKGIIGINILTVATQYKELIEAAVKEKIDIIISGAGLAKDLPKYVEGTKTKIIPIVSSGRAAGLMAKLWIRNYNYVPDAIIVEGPEAGGHLGFTAEEMEKGPADLSTILKDVITSLKPIEEKYDKKIPVIAAGGIFDGKDVAKYISEGAAGVQISTPLVATEECDAHENFKLAYVDAKEKDVVIVQSPVGLPGRAIRNELIEKLESQRIPVDKCYRCIGHCNPATTQYCISDALIAAVQGDVKNGLIFCGSNVTKIDKISTVKEVLDKIIIEAENSF
ncbi:NAD(P)H-dependent flavin oxidoreductase [Alkalibacter mobilis]|uniref:NAD(P)H-dependent flavin oxidoreductase n=1 Tax=Alkalibacter mobilis TaxID=2787712 RepID=UPI00189EEF96|nr:nitronate monooxygenase family protein [Alkalibacter mobilis]MBF7097066.1 nitronate monooxygenase [Alkalibacter mobilis]